MKNMSLDYFEFCTMLSGRRLDDLKFYEVSNIKVLESEGAQPFESMYHVSDGTPRDKEYDPQMGGTTWHEKTFVFYPAGSCTDEQSKEFVEGRMAIISKDIRKSKIDFGEYVYSGGSVLSMNYKKSMSFQELPENIKVVVIELFKQADHFGKNSNRKDFSVISQ